MKIILDHHKLCLSQVYFNLSLSIFFLLNLILRLLPSEICYKRSKYIICAIKTTFLERLHWN